MKKIQLLIIAAAIIAGCNQSEKTPTLTDTREKADTPIKVLPPVTHITKPDQSPMDMVYFPNDFPLLKMSGNAQTPFLRIIYSRPQKQGRKVFGNLIKYNEPWRLGANEATEIEFFSNATIQNKKISAGRYILYCIPQEKKWVLLFNSNLYNWGLQQDPKKDLMQFEVPVEKNNIIIEIFTIVSEKKSERSTDITFYWDDVKVKLPVSF
jgi:Protein of unknown function (DUF2911)